MDDETGRGDKRAPSPLVKAVTNPDVFTVLMLTAVAAMPLIPGAWLACLPLSVLLCAAMASRKTRLPYRLPLSWKGRDYGSPLPGGGKKFRSGEGLLFLGNEIDSQEEIWISNSDARRHALVLATTGAGKALPDEVLVLTPDGWRRNGGLRAGDRVIHPSGRELKILSVHPQGRLPVVRLTFADGRAAECSRDHLWRVRLRESAGVTEKSGLWTAADIGIALRLGALNGNGGPRVFIELPRPVPGSADAPRLTPEAAETAAAQGLDRLGFMPSLSGSPEQRLSWLAAVIRMRGITCRGDSARPWIEIPCLNDRDGFLLRHMIWSLGGSAMQLSGARGRQILFRLPGQETVQPGIPSCDPSLTEDGLEVTGAEGSFDCAEAKDMRRRVRRFIQSGRIRENEAGRILKEFRRIEKPMTCIRTDADDGMFIAESYLPTHNTEFLLGLASQSLMWSSGFLFIDGKGTTEFHAKAWSIVSKFGRQDDYRVLNFTDGGAGGDMAAGGPEVQSNTLNPFAEGSSDQLMNLIVSLMGEAGNAGEMWRHRAMALVTSTMKALVEIRDAGDIMLDVQTIRDFLPLGSGVRRKFLGGKRIADISGIPDAAWDELRGRGGLIELYLRALRGEFSEKSRLALKGFFDSLPGFSLERALNGDPQEGKAAEQYGFLSMQLTKPLGSLADDFGHIFRTPIGEVNMDDVVLNRRVLVVLLPALQKAPEEMRNCGRIVVAMLKMMMGRAAGSRLEGTKRELIDIRPSNAPSPFIVVLDEAGYYMVKGIDTMMAQARSLGFMIIIAGQDMASMQSVSPQIAETAAANARLTVAGATEDAKRTWEFLRSKFARQRVAVASGRIRKSGWLSAEWVDRPDRQFVETDRVPIRELQKLREGEFYFLMESRLVKARAFHIEECCAPWLAINKFLAVRGPYDPVLKGRDSGERRFLDAVGSIAGNLLDEQEMLKRERNFPFDPHDGLHCAVRYAAKALEQERKQRPGSCDALSAGMLGLAFGTQLRMSDSETESAEDGREGWDSGQFAGKGASE